MADSPSRRGLLASVGTGVTTLLAGCSDTRTRSTSTPEARANPIDGTATEMTRTTGDRPPVVTGPEAGSDDEQTSTPEPIRSRIVGSASDAADLQFAPEATNVGAVRRLLAETTYAEECVFVYQTRIRACYRLELNYVSRDADGDPSFDFCEVIRDADTACERESRDYVAAFVRLPFPGDDYGGYSVGRGGGCDPVPGEHREGESA